MTTPHPHPAPGGREPQPAPAPAAPPGPRQAAPGAAAAPPRRTHLGHALASEWTKIRTVRSTVWTLGVMFLLVVGIGVPVALARRTESPDVVTMPLLGGGLFGLMLGQICVLTLGALVITSEYGTGMIRTTMTSCPARGRVLLAKALVLFLVAFLTTTAATSLTALIQHGALGGMPIRSGDYVGGDVRNPVVEPFTATGGEWFDATVGAGLYVALLGLLSLAVGAMLRHSAGAITTMLGLVLLPMLVALFMRGESLRDVSDALLEYSPLNGLAAMFRMPMQGGTDPWTLLGLLAAVTGAALAGAYAALAARDV
ncbi:ABC transporter permease [Streptomyces sp. TR06-5]|uniref:ABC transporter permease n=1 Tax=unclassified Streptomyces TaxID=2593676 RepID=UPI0039A35624